MRPPFRRILPFSLAVLLVAAEATAQPIEGGARAGALAGAVTALPGEAWSLGNPAGRGPLREAVAAFFASQGYGMAELRLASALAALPTRAGVFAFRAQSFGFEDFRETRYAGGYARGFSVGPARRIYAGVEVAYHTVQVAGYGSAGAVGVSAGWVAELFPGLHAGFAALNLNAPEYAPGEPLPRSLALGVAYRPVERALVLLDAVKDARHPLAVRAGLEVLPVPALALRAGVATEPVRFATGVGVRAGFLRADVAAERHEVLGWTPAVSLGIAW